jgi:hypothetical protein
MSRPGRLYGQLRALAAQKGPVSVINWAEVAALELKV